MEDLFDVQVKHMDTVFKASRDIQADDLVSRAVYEVSTTTYLIINAFQANRFSSTPIDEAKLKTHLFASVEWVTTLFYILEIDPPDLEDIISFADGFDSEIAADAVLAALHVQRSLADFALDYFCNDGAEGDKEELDGYIGEILACLELIARRFNSTLSALIMKI